MNRLDRLTPLMEGFVKRGPAGCACSVAQGGKTLYENYIGYADLETKKPIGPDAIYRIYSNTKVVTAVATLILYEKGLFLLNDPLEEYLPEFRNAQVYRYTPSNALYTSPAATPIRIKDLLTMSSGITYPDPNLETGRQMGKAVKELGANGKKYNARDFSRAVAAIPLAFDPGTHWNYGMSFEILGALIEVLSGRKFSDFMKDEIFDPLGMNDTSFRLPEGKKDRLCSLYERSEDGKLTKITDKDAFYQPDATMEEGGAGLLSTLADYSRFAQALACGELDGVRILSPDTVRLMATNCLSPQQLADYNWPYLAGFGYGLGVRVLMDKAAGGSNASIGEFGWSGYAGTWVMIDPSRQLSSVYMQQMIPNFEAYHQPRLRNVIYGAL